MHATVSLASEQISHFHDLGYLRLENISTPGEVARLREIFDRLFAERAGWDRGQSFDLAGSDEAGKAPVLPQIINPVEFAPELRDTLFRTNALTIARQLLGADAEPWFEHAICKPAGIGAPTPWHQDEAHRYDPGIDYDQLSVWMPLQPATPENGCMQYVPRSHHGPVLEHRSLDGDARKSALECVGDFDRSAAIACPLPPGGAAIHHCRTLHCAGANHTGEPRRAYVLAFRGAPRPAPARDMFPWLIGKETPAAQRARAWENRGGSIGRYARRIAQAARDLSRKVTRRLRRIIKG
jgi:ectoine hydroxylase-related dioxygenase (phytanoyl-CoA dioxygenase family)